MDKFKAGDRVICNGNNDAYVLGYYTEKMVEVDCGAAQDMWAIHVYIRMI